MNIQAINNQMFMAKVPQKPLTRISTVGKVDSYVDDMLRAGNEQLQKAAEDCDVFVKIAQRKGNSGNDLLVNAGPKTTAFSLNDMKTGDEFYNNILANIKENGCILCRK